MWRTKPILYISHSSDGHMGFKSPQNRLRFFKKIGVNENQVVNVFVNHGTNIKLVGRNDAGKVFDKYDGLMTNKKGLFLGLLVGDCIPIAIYDPDKGVVAIIHCGWRGLSKGIIKKCLTKMTNRFATNVGSVNVYIGAHICVNHYQVGIEVAKKFTKYPEFIKEVGKKYFLDLGKVATKQLVDTGVKKEHIKTDKTCTFENSRFFSYRRNGTKERNLYLLSLGA